MNKYLPLLLLCAIFSFGSFVPVTVMPVPAQQFFDRNVDRVNRPPTLGSSTLSGPTKTKGFYNYPTRTGGTSNNAAGTFSVLNGRINVAACGALRPPSWCAGSDIGAWINAAVAQFGLASPLQKVNVNYSIPTIVIPSGTYSYSTTPIVSSPFTFDCEPGAVLNYTGSGTAWRMGPAGLSASMPHYAPYVLRHCTFTGGRSMTAGIVWEPYVIQPISEDVRYYDFGNATAYAQNYLANNWKALSLHERWWSDTNSQNFMNFAAGESRIVVDGLQAHGGVTGVKLAGTHSALINSSLESFTYPVKIGSNFAIEILNNYFEASSANCIIYFGDDTVNGSHLSVGTNIKDNRANMHHELGNTSSFVCPWDDSAGLQGAVVEANRVTNLNTKAYLVNQNPGVANQTANYANFNRDNDGAALLTLGQLHPASATVWNAPQVDPLMPNGNTIAGSAIPSLSRSNSWTAHNYATAAWEWDSGANTLWFSDSGITLTAKIDGKTGNAIFENVAAQLTAKTYTFATLPSVAAGTTVYCSDCKNNYNDGAAYDSIALGGGHGCPVNYQNGAWHVK